jgi:hypothetical protein
VICSAKFGFIQKAALNGLQSFRFPTPDLGLSFWLSHQNPICIPLLPIRATCLAHPIIIFKNSVLVSRKHSAPSMRFEVRSRRLRRILRHVMPCSVVGVFQCFRGTFCLHRQDRFGRYLARTPGRPLLPSFPQSGYDRLLRDPFQFTIHLVSQCALFNVAAGAAVNCPYCIATLRAVGTGSGSLPS